MADIADLANEQVAKQEAMMMRRFQAAKNQAQEYTGKCFNCEEVIENPKRFCDVDCRDDWQRRAK